jgi:1,4-alpha-glucan branching enzyme
VDREEKPTSGPPRIDPAAPDAATVERLLGGTQSDPHAVLGAHPHLGGTTVRLMRPDADEVHVIRQGAQRQPLTRVHEAGLFCEVVRPGRGLPPRGAPRRARRHHR